MKKFLLFSSLLLTQIWTPSIAYANTFKDAIAPCLKPEAHRELKSVEIYQQIESLYASDLLVSFGGTDYHAMKVIKIEDDRCQTIFSDVYDRVSPLSEVMPLEQAKEFRLGWEKREVERKGRDQVQDWLSKHVLSLSAESQWAFKELGFTLRSDIKTCPQETPNELYCF